MAATCPMCGRPQASSPLCNDICICPKCPGKLFRRIVHAVSASSTNDLILLTVNHFPTWTVDPGRCACGPKWPCCWVLELASRFDLEVQEEPEALIQVDVPLWGPPPDPLTSRDRLQ